MKPAPEFPIVFVTEADYELSSNEMMGSKYKFWFEHEQLGRCLYKQARPNLGEDWAEKVASELSELLGLPHATYHLAETWEGNWGVVSPYFLPGGGTLVHGNEILTPIVPNYPTFVTYGASQHTIDIVLQVIAADYVGLPIAWTPPSGIQTAVEVFVGYLLLDAWIGNGDRHHENWAFVRNKVASTETVHLAHTYDHASCLGRDLPDGQRQKRSIEAYANKCYSAFYNSVEDKKPLKTFDVFHRVAHRYPQAADVWLERLESISRVNTFLIFSRIQRKRISTIAVEFAQNILEFNQHKLLKLRELLQ
ncbi:HipA-like protein [Dolichospermum sp. LEGE 00246]|uniref:HipA-like protein n=1 Tax=Dolichospermum sp. LEGE 00246 TaxID=1828605 RepID=UPI0018830580|nr:HipA-like protein [Dolichospermum sp. LEGE 00246]MBE9256376.1 HipA-like protein [Dolichospermum sp. LEGE 00246]